MLQYCWCCCWVTSVLSDSVRPHRQQPTRLHHPWDSPGKNTGVGCHFLLQCMKVKSESEDTQSCPTLSDPMHCSLPGCSIHGIFQARVLEWGAIAFSAPILGTYNFISYWWINPFIIYNDILCLLLYIALTFFVSCYSFWPKVFFVWYKCSYPCLFLFPLAWNISFHCFTFNLSVFKCQISLI